ncbi:hypothetical protein JCGZ_12164 [Jatropha curcas]|uniref:Methyltransferase n=1 Tax=Jatropha curcas TaxID=180498 RepID=A0A067K9S8_JATCU|nr:probable methyltransferase PMT10 [Jatropha curcas]KDP32872.1 hypothetical protein JCGZ_12164 [Jatropha curcas]
MKSTAITTAAVDVVKTPNFVKILALALLSFSLVAFFYYLTPIPFATSTLSSPAIGGVTNSAITSSYALPPHPKPNRVHPPSWVTVAPRIGIVDESGAMTVDFEIGDFDSSELETLRNLSDWREEEKEEQDNGTEIRVGYNKYKVCEDTMIDYIPCLENVDELRRLNLSNSVEKFERHCPEEGKGLDCLVPMPKEYQKRIPWPKSRDEVWFSNVNHATLVKDKSGKNWISRKGDKLTFAGGGPQFVDGIEEYLNQISQMVPDIAFGQSTRVALDIGCRVASFGAYLLQRNVTTLSIAPKDATENQIQFALERGVPAMVAIFGTRRLLYPSQAFDLIHCSRCGVDWIRDDGILLLEANRMLRGGGYFVWAAQPVYKQEDNLQQQWIELQNLTSHICWELVKKEGFIAIWRKPLNNSCYVTREAGTQPPLCDSSDDPDNVWYINLKACIPPLPENGYGVNVTTWPIRLHNSPERLQSIKMDASISRKELFKAESKYWNEIIKGYINGYHWKQMNFRNVMDMRAGFGGFAAALHDLQIDCWVMNVVPVSGFNTLPVIYDRGLIGVMHDWCEPFDTYPRTYDLIHAAGLFSAEQKRQKCNISTIMLEMDRMLRPGGIAYVRDTVLIMGEIEAIARAMGWVPSLHDTGEGPHASWKVLICDKRMP